MILLDVADPESERVPRWQRSLQGAVRSVERLAAMLELDPAELGAFAPGRREFPLLVPVSYVERMRKRDRTDPLLRQILPLLAERDPTPGFSVDPLEEAVSAANGVLVKYPGRALLIASAACPVHCRYCFRRSFPYGEHLAARDDWQPALDRLRAMKGIREVILSGGDPLSLSNRRLRALVEALARIETVGTLRIHTRFPIILPERIDRGLLRVLDDAELDTVMVVHCNHANEIDGQVAGALAALKTSSKAVLNQSVLLRGVNDDTAALAQLSERLFDCGVLPYYLHLLDRVAGTAHFEVSEPRALELIAALRERLPGYLVPRLVREIPGRLSKTPLS
jgi:EF-P beta-lysylation protein EpmB